MTLISEAEAQHKSHPETQWLQKQWEKLWQLPQMQALVSRSPRWRYWRVRKDNYAYAFTTERDSKGKFYAFVWRILKNGTWKRKKTVAFGRRNKAKARALKWYNERKTILEAMQ